VLAVSVVGFPFALVLLVGLTVWLIYRVARGWIALSGVKSMDKANG
jgi:uncharacterized membrane protein